MYKILAKEILTPTVTMFKVEASAIAEKARPGQFVIIRLDKVGERFPLTLADWDNIDGTISLVTMQIGTSTHKLARLNTGDYILNLVGPLGLPSEIDNFGTVICIGGGVGVAPIFDLKTHQMTNINFNGDKQ